MQKFCPCSVTTGQATRVAVRKAGKRNTAKHLEGAGHLPSNWARPLIGGSGKETDMPLLDEIIGWAGGLRPWQQEALRRIFARAELTQDDIETIL